MEASPIGKRFRSWGQRLCTASPSLGREYERQAAKLATTLGYKVLARNFRIHNHEGDLLVWCPRKNCVYVWEVRGKRKKGFRPSLTISPQKILRLKRLAAFVQQRTRFPVRLQLVECVGRFPWARWKIYEIGQDF